MDKVIIFIQFFLVMLKPALITILSLFISLWAVAQKDTTFYYMKADGRRVLKKEDGDLVIKVCPPEPGGNPKLYVIAGFYDDGTKLMHAYSLTPKFPPRLEGHYITYFKNGNKMSDRNFEDGDMVGEQVLYYPNGNLYNKMRKLAGLSNTKMLYNECRDSTGKILAENGNGTWITYNQDFSRITEQGKIVNGLKDSIWTENDASGSHFIKYKTGKEIIDSMTNQIFTSVEVVPEFPGGLDALSDFLNTHIKYPNDARTNHIQGTVILSFVVDIDGSLSDIKVVKGIGWGCDEEAIRVLKSSPRWKPGTQQGKPVRVQYSLPINFSLGK
jgi:TonB family protein